MNENNENRTRNDDLSNQSESDVYKLTPARLSRHRSTIERRAFKNSLGDRRSKVRLTASGKPQPDRRVANRVANERLTKKTG
ncbi:MAG: hypothetical protein AB8B84_09740 [Granulosicoccus sp.]